MAVMNLRPNPSKKVNIHDVAEYILATHAIPGTGKIEDLGLGLEITIKNKRLCRVQRNGELISILWAK